MRIDLSAALAMLLAVVLSGPAEARSHAYHQACYGLHYDLSHGNVLSPLTYIYPVANWGPFFQCHVYYGAI